MSIAQGLGTTDRLNSPSGNGEHADFTVDERWHPTAMGALAFEAGERDASPCTGYS